MSRPPLDLPSWNSSAPRAADSSVGYADFVLLDDSTPFAEKARNAEAWLDPAGDAWADRAFGGGPGHRASLRPPEVTGSDGEGVQEALWADADGQGPLWSAWSEGAEGYGIDPLFFTALAAQPTAEMPSFEGWSEGEEGGYGPLFGPESNPVVSVEALEGYAAEAGRVPGAFRVSRTGSTAADLTVSFTLGGTAETDVDYRAVQSVVIPAGESSAIVIVDSIDDYLDEGAETVELTLTADPTYEVGAEDSATVAVLDDDFDDTENEPPLAVDDEAETDEDTSVSFGVRGNDSDPDGDPLTVVRVYAPTAGEVVLNTDQTLRYTPKADWSGVDTVKYLVTDCQGKADVGVVTITVDAVNDAPEVGDDAYGLHPNAGGISVPGEQGLLRDVSDADADDTLAVMLVDGPEYGYLNLNADGSFWYYPDLPEAPGDSFTFRAYDGTAYSATATVTLTIHQNNEAPQGVEDAYSLRPNTSLTLALDTLLDNDYDLDDDFLSVESLSGVSHGTLVDQYDGTYLYAPDEDYVGEDSFTYVLSDGLDESDPVTVTLTVYNTAPVAEDDRYEVKAHEPLEVGDGGVAANDADPDDPYAPVAAVELVTGPENGELILNTDGSFTYTADSGFVGVDTFTYRATDGLVFSEVATVTLEVLDLAPNAVADHYLFHPAQMPIAGGVLQNDYDRDGDMLTTELVEAPSHAASFTLLADGYFSYQAQTGFVGTDTFTYRAGDGTLWSEETTVTIVVSNGPVAEQDFYAVDEEYLTQDGWLEVDVDYGLLQNDWAYPAAPTQAKLVSGSGPQYGTLEVDADQNGFFDGSFRYQPGQNFSGTDSFSYAAVDPITGQLAVAAVALAAVDLSSNVKLESVRFGEDRFRLVSDVAPFLVYRSGTFDETVIPPLFKDLGHWYDADRDGVIEAGDRAYPVRAVANTRPKVDASLHINGSDIATTLIWYKLLGRLKLRAEGNAGLLFEVGAENLQMVGLKLQVKEAVVSKDALANKVDFFDPLVLTWKLSIDRGTTWQTVGTSRNTLYVSLGEPDMAQQADTHHILFRLGSKAVQGATTRHEVIARIWNQFDLSWANWLGRPVPRPFQAALLGLQFDQLAIRRTEDGVKLGYYRTWPGTQLPQTTTQLLRAGNGQCTHWAALFRDLLNAQGIIDEGGPLLNLDVVRVTRDLKVGETDSWFMVKNWAFSAAGLLRGNPKLDPADKEFEYVNVPAADPPLGADDASPSFQNNAYTWRPNRADVTDQIGAGGHDSPNPMSIFNNHIIMKLGGTYYDPSYGLNYGSLAVMQRIALDAFYKAENYAEAQYGVDFDGDGDQMDMIRVFQIRKTPNALGLKATVVG